MKRVITICAIAAVILTANDLVQAATLKVPAAYPTIQAAINAAFDDDEVVVGNGNYTGTGNRDIEFFGKAITVRSKYGPENCIIDCQGSIGDKHRGFYFHSGETSSAVLDGFTIKNGYKHPGAGIRCSDSSPIIKNCVITRNTAERSNGIGGGCYFSNSFAEIINCRITFNSAIGTSPHSGNGWGGGIACSGSTLEIKNTEISNNSGTSSSGGVGAGWDSSLYIENCLISHNSSQFGGGLKFQDSDINITNSTITKNSVEFSGGGFYCIRSNIIVINTILWGDIGGEIDGWGSEITVTYSDVQGGWEGEGNIDADPLFADADGRLSPGSPCIDAGDNTAVTSGTDLDGNPRIVNDIVDMGAFEANPIVMLANTVIDLYLQSGIENSLLAKLDAAQKANDSVAINLLQAFISAVEAQSGKQIPETDADTLIAAAQQIINLLGSG